MAHQTIHWFEARVEALAEPGGHGVDDPHACPPEGFACATGNCGCRDFYAIRIFKQFDPETQRPNKKGVIYEIYAYLGGGNHQIHRPTEGVHTCHGGGDERLLAIDSSMLRANGKRASRSCRLGSSLYLKRQDCPMGSVRG